MFLRTPALVAAMLLSSCGRPLLTPPPRVRALSVGDSRRALVGLWKIEFTIDSVQNITTGKGGARSSLLAVTPSTVAGTLELRDTVDGIDGLNLKGTVALDFQRLLGQPLSCYDPRYALVGVKRRNTHVRLELAPGAADCGLYADGRYLGDSVVGSWLEDSFIGPRAVGRFRMLRLASGG